MVLYGIIRYIYYDIRYYRYKVERRGIKYQNFLYHCVLPKSLIYYKLTVLLFRRQFEVNKIKNFFTIGVGMDFVFWD